MVAFHAVVQILAIDMGDIVKVWIVAMVDFADHLPVGGCFISADRNGTVQPYALNCFVQKGFCSLRIASCCETEITSWPLAPIARHR
ncbi:hypothetical protein AN189_18440 [Loktanella sp. 3ANDIMAR09]|nr:hypothetical protein AN189_18440 [Loktanella sp. 3ANDIMAR09]